MNKTLETALRWHDLGIACIPCLWHSKKPALESWREFQTTLPRKSQLRAWFANSGYNLAVVCGHQNLVVVDFDCEVEFTKWWNSLKAPVVYTVEWTYKVKTPRGYHLYFYIDEMPESAKFGKVDVKAHGTYVLAPPSVHPCGKPYLEGSDRYSYDIIPLKTIYEILPAYQYAALPHRPKINAYDPFEDAMRPCSDGGGASVEEIKAHWSIAFILGRDENHLRWQINCPFSDHHDEHASFMVYPDGHFYCFGCRRHGGDVIDLYAALHNISVQDAIREMGNARTNP